MPKIGEKAEGFRASFFLHLFALCTFCTTVQEVIFVVGVLRSSKKRCLPATQEMRACSEQSREQAESMC